MDFLLSLAYTLLSKCYVLSQPQLSGSKGPWPCGSPQEHRSNTKKIRKRKKPPLWRNIITEWAITALRDLNMHSSIPSLDGPWAWLEPSYLPLPVGVFLPCPNRTPVVREVCCLCALRPWLPQSQSAWRQSPLLLLQHCLCFLNPLRRYLCLTSSGGWLTGSLLTSVAVPYVAPAPALPASKFSVFSWALCPACLGSGRFPGVLEDCVRPRHHTLLLKDAQIWPLEGLKWGEFQNWGVTGEDDLPSIFTNWTRWADGPCRRLLIADLGDCSQVYIYYGVVFSCMHYYFHLTNAFKYIGLKVLAELYFSVSFCTCHWIYGLKPYLLHISNSFFRASLNNFFIRFSVMFDIVIQMHQWLIFGTPPETETVLFLLCS